jgi:hypothetical protein
LALSIVRRSAAAHRCAWLTGTLLIPALAAQAATPEDARRAYDAGRFTDAMGIWAQLSTQGNAEAAYGIGMLYDLGNGTREDPSAAFSWYKVAAEAGMPAAEFNVGAMLDAGRGVAQDYASAANWYARAAAHGHSRAQFNLGMLYEYGEGVPLNRVAAAVWYRLAAAGGISTAVSRPKPPAAPATGAIMPTAVTLTAPEQDAKVSLTKDSPNVELVWSAPPEPWPARYEVQVRDLNSSDLPVVFDRMVEETAVLAKVPDKSAFYVWNVVTIGPDGSRLASDWHWFSASASTQSLASGAQ